MNAKISLYVVTGCMVFATVAYLLFLAASWNQYQEDRSARSVKIDEILDRLPKKKAGPEVVVTAE
jgi:hypothetical protein